MDDPHRRKLRFRAWRRGFRELDLVMGNFADAEIEAFTDTELAEFERLLSAPDWEVWAWLTGQSSVPDNWRGPVLDRLIAFRYATLPG
jgi:antitoxin CptB